MSEIFKYLKDLSPDTNNHGTGKKYVFLSNERMDSPLTQIAYGQLEPGEGCEEHLHPTMDECFYFIKGQGQYQVGEETVELKPETFLRIPATYKHSLKVTGNQPLEFVYWGVATDSI